MHFAHRSYGLALASLASLASAANYVGVNEVTVDLSVLPAVNKVLGSEGEVVVADNAIGTNGKVIVMDSSTKTTLDSYDTTGAVYVEAQFTIEWPTGATAGADFGLRVLYTVTNSGEHAVGPTTDPDPTKSACGIWIVGQWGSDTLVYPEGGQQAAFPRQLYWADKALPRNITDAQQWDSVYSLGPGIPLKVPADFQDSAQRLRLGVRQVCQTPATPGGSTPLVNDFVIARVQAYLRDPAEEPTTSPSIVPTSSTPAETTSNVPAETTGSVPAEPANDVPTETTSSAPAEPTSAAPAEPTSSAPAGTTSGIAAEPTSAAPAEPTSSVPAEPTNNIPAETTSAAPTEPTSSAPAGTTSGIAAEPTSAVPAEPTTAASMEPTSSAPAEPTSHIPTEPTSEISTEPVSTGSVGPTSTDPTATVTIEMPTESSSSVTDESSATTTTDPLPTSTAALPGPARIGNYKYAGCASSPLPSQGSSPFILAATRADNSLDVCAGICQTRNKTLSGTSGADCFCGNGQAATLSTVRDALCDTPCPGNPYQSCGGRLLASKRKIQARQAPPFGFLLTVYVFAPAVDNTTAAAAPAVPTTGSSMVVFNNTTTTNKNANNFSVSINIMVPVACLPGACETRVYYERVPCDRCTRPGEELWRPVRCAADACVGRAVCRPEPAPGCVDDCWVETPCRDCDGGVVYKPQSVAPEPQATAAPSTDRTAVAPATTWTAGTGRLAASLAAALAPMAVVLFA